MYSSSLSLCEGEMHLSNCLEEILIQTENTLFWAQSITGWNIWNRIIPYIQEDKVKQLCVRFVTILFVTIRLMLKYIAL